MLAATFVYICILTVDFLPFYTASHGLSYNILVTAVHECELLTDVNVLKSTPLVVTYVINITSGIKGTNLRRKLKMYLAVRGEEGKV